MTRRREVHDRINAVEIELKLARFAVDRLYFDAARGLDPMRGRPSLRNRDIVACRNGLEGTYFVRLFSVFEDALRDWWEVGTARDTQPKMTDLVNGCSSRRRVPEALRTEAHEAREWRNHLVHGGDANRVTFVRGRETLAVLGQAREAESGHYAA